MTLSATSSAGSEIIASTSRGALHHPAGELRRVIVEAPRGGGDAHRLQQRDHPAPRLVLRHAGGDGPHLLGDLPADRERRIEGAHRVGADIGDCPAQGAHRAGVEAEDVPAPEADGAAGGERPVQAVHHGLGQHRLARAGRADHPHDLAGGDVEGDAIEEPPPAEGRARATPRSRTDRIGASPITRPRGSRCGRARRGADQVDPGEGEAEEQAGMVAIHHALRRYFRPSAMTLPKVGVGGWTPSRGSPASIRRSSSARCRGPRRRAAAARGAAPAASRRCARARPPRPARATYSRPRSAITTERITRA